MFKLSSLPVEILYTIGGFLETKDLITLARLSSWYSYILSTQIGERINEYVKHEGWRIHIDILAKSYPIRSTAHSRLPFSTELLLLGEYKRINPCTLALEFSLCPIDDAGLSPMKNTAQNERSIVLFNQIKTNIDIVAYFARISSKRRLQHVNHAGASIMSDKNLWYQYSVAQPYSGMTVMGSSFKIQYNMSEPQPCQDQAVDTFKLNYNRYFKDICNIDREKEVAVVSFDKIRVSPEWWMKQMQVTPYESPEHGFW